MRTGPAAGPKRGRDVPSFLQRGTHIACAVVLATLLHPGAASARRPVVAPGQQVPTKPPPPPEIEAAAPNPEEATPAAPGGSAAGAPPPLDFNDAGQVVQPIEAPKALDELGPHRELRYTRRVGDFVYQVHVRPGEPKPGTPIELFLRVNELLPIPDPALGDRRPLEGGRLLVTVKGNGSSRTYRTHALLDAGTYGTHFTVDAPGLYDLAIERLGARRPERFEVRLGVGTETPGIATPEAGPRRRDRDGVVEGIEMVGVAGPDDATIAGVMDELGRRWMELDRLAGSEDAAEALRAVREQAALAAGKMPQGRGGNPTEFDQLVAGLADRLAALEGATGDRTALRAGMLRVQEEVCMRCHALYRHGIAESVAAWPDFSPKEKLEPPAAEPARGTRTRTPFRAR